MTFRNDEGEVLDFDGDFAITKRAVSFFTSKILGDFSTTFQVDNNSVNRKVLGYDGPQMVNQVAFTRQAFTLVRNGNNFARGFIVIQSDNGATLSCYFISGNSNWINLLNGLITELDYSGVTNVTNYETLLDITTVNAKLHSTSGVVFPLVDWAYAFNKGGDTYALGFDLVDVKGDTLQTVMDYYPCFYLKTLVDEITKQNSIKIAGDVLLDPLYNRFILPPNNGQIKRADIRVTTAYGSTFSTSAGPVKYDQFTDGSDPDGNFANDEYTVPFNAKIIISYTIVTSTVPAGSNLIVAGALNGTPGISGLTFTTSVSVTSTTVTATGTFVKGDVISLYVQRSGAAGTVDVTLNIKFDIPTNVTTDDYVTPDLFLPPLRSLDIIKFLVNYFGCACSYSEYSKTITINTIDGFKLEDAEDWSDYIQVNTISMDYTIQSAKNNYQRLQEPEDARLRGYNKGRVVKYGEGNIETENTLKEINELMQVPFAPSDFSLSKNNIWQSSVPIIKLRDSGEAITYQSTSNVAGRRSYNYTFDYLFEPLQLVRIVDDNQGDIGIFYTTNSGTITLGSVQFEGLTFTTTSTGRLYIQEIEYQSIAPRILLNKPETSVGDFGSALNALSAASRSFAHFCKPVTGDIIDSYKANAAFDNPDGNFSDPTINQMYFSKIGRMLGNPTLKAKFLLPESVFQDYDFQSFIYLKTEKLTGYFYPEGITNYHDGNTPVEITFYML